MARITQTTGAIDAQSADLFWTGAADRSE